MGSKSNEITVRKMTNHVLLRKVYIPDLTPVNLIFNVKTRKKVFNSQSCCCCCDAYLSSCHRTASNANLLDDPHTFHCIDYFVIGGIRTCLGVSYDSVNVPVDFFEYLFSEFAAFSKPPSRDNHRKASYPRTQQYDQDAG